MLEWKWTVKQPSNSSVTQQPCRGTLCAVGGADSSGGDCMEKAVED